MKSIFTVSLILLSYLASEQVKAASVIGKTWFPDLDGLSYTAEDLKTIDPILQVGFFTDADNEDNVYYIPPFIPVEGVSGTLALNTIQMKRADKIENVTNDFANEQIEIFKDLQVQVAQTRSTYNAISEKLANLPSEQEFLRPQIQAILVNLKNEMDALDAKLKTVDLAIPAPLRTIRGEQIGAILGSANIDVQGLDLTLTKDQWKASGKLNASYGGVLAVNMVAGLTAEQLAAVRKFKELRANSSKGSISFAMLPVKTVAWQKLTETVGDDSKGVPLYKNVSGGGGLQGATATLDLTVDGARSLGVSPPPFILPIGASAQVIQTLPPFSAKLDCVIKSGWFFNGRTDIRDGLIIYNNDITQNIVSDAYGTTGTKESPCQVSYEGGGDPGQAVREAAIRASLDQIMAELEALGIERSNLAYAERKKFADSVQADIAANRHKGSNKGWASAIRSFGGSVGSFLGGGGAGGLMGGVTSLFSQASNFYWHTDKRNVSMTDTIEFHTSIAERGNSEVKIALPMQICLAWHPETKAYVRCANSQINTAYSLTEASTTAKKSPECESVETSAECGERRNISEPKNPSNGTIDLPATI